jgi:hypothetical protein
MYERKLRRREEIESSLNGAFGRTRPDEQSEEGSPTWSFAFKINNLLIFNFLVIFLLINFFEKVYILNLNGLFLIYCIMKNEIEVIKSEENDYYSDDDLFKISSWGADLSFRELIERY